MEIRQLRYFLDIAQTEHLTQSAQNLFVTQSTLSQAGAEFRAYATRALKEIEAGRMALADLSGLQSGRLTIGAIPTFLNTVLPATVAAFCERYPKVQVEVRDLRAGPIEDQLMSGELDLGIAFHPTRHGEIETEPLFEERMMVVLRKTAPQARGQHITLKRAAQLPMALLPRSFATRRMLDEKFRQAGAEPQVRVEMESVEALLGVCRHGPLATIVPERAALQMPDLHAMALTAPEVVRHAGLLWRRSASRSVAAREFAALLRAALIA